MARDNTLINKLIRRISRRDALQRADIHTALVECAMFAFEDRNADPAIRLFKAVGNGTNRKAMSHWLSQNACIFFKDDEPKLADKRQKEMALFSDEEKAKYVAELETLPKWYEYAATSNAATNIWDTDGAAAKMREYLDGVAKKAKKNDDSAINELAMSMAALITKFEAARAAEKAAEEVTAEE